MKLFNLILLLLTTSIITFGQTYEIDAYNGQTVNTCTGTFYDSGGAGADYQSSEDYTITFCTDQAGSQISLEFTDFHIESASFDHMDIYDGVGTGGTQLVASAGSEALLGQIIESQGSGCLTIVFHSDGSVTYPGWEASISCSFPCQDFTADIINTSEPYYNGDTIRMCQNTPLTFTAAGTYPNNGTNYTQSDATSTFHWDFGDGTDTTGIGLSTVSHSFPEGGFYVFLDVTDNNNCNNSNLVMNTVMVSTTPLFTGTNITDTICPGETINFTGQANTHSWSQPLPAIVGDTTFLPDGSGASYETSLTYNIFQTNATLTDITDLESICMDLEHSYSGDLQISIICPNGQEMMLFDGYGNTNISNEFLGEPTDGSSNPGTPYTYCWSTSATNGTMEDVGANPPVYTFTDNDGNTYTDHAYIPGGTYESSGDWTQLLGCPLNGDWTIHVIDNMNIDDGYIFAWTIDWDSTLTTSLWEFGNTYDNTLYSWSGQNINSQNNGIGTAVPTTTGGTELYTFTATDDFGCTYDTILPVYIYPTNSPGCCVTPIAEAGNNDSICGLSIQLNATYFDINNSGLWTVTGPGNVSFDDPTSNTATATADTYGEYTFTWTELNPAGCQASDVVTINYNPSADISMSMEMTQCYGSSDGSLTVVHNTTTDAPYSYLWDNNTTNISNTNLPYGTYTVFVANIHGCLTSLTDSVLQPTQLVATTSTTPVLCFNGADGTATVNASNATPNYTYLWSDANAQTTQTATNLAAGPYTVIITDANGCNITKNINIEQPAMPLGTSTSSTDALCFGSSDGTGKVTVTGGTTPYSYLWSNGQTTSNATNLSANTYTVNITDANGCTISDNITINEPSQITSSYTSTSLGCAGANNGNINLTVAGGTPNYNFLWNNGATTQNLQNIGGDIYSVTITDNNGCILIHNNIVITEPAPVIASVTPESSICLTNSKELVCSAIGGTPPYTYAWNTGETTYNITVAPTDTTSYSIIVTDANGCESELTETTVNVRPPISATAVGDNIEVCPGDPLNIVVTPKGGNGHYYYTLQDGQNVTNNFIVYPNETTTYIITVSDDCGSPTSSAQVDVSVLDAPPLSFSADITQGCQPLIVTFTEQSDDEGQTYDWDFGDNSPSNIGTEKQPIHIYENSGQFDVSLQVTSVEGCKTTQHMFNLIDVYKNPVAKFFTNKSDASIIKPEIIFNNNSIDGYNYYWDFGDGNTFIGTETIHTYPSVSNEYTVTLIAESDKGCRDTTHSSVYIYDISTFYTPTAFSPDGDGINDVWKVVGSGIDLDNIKLQVYDRWGEVIFETNDLSTGWNGISKNNKVAPAGIYYWIIVYNDLSGTQYEEAGRVTIIK